MTRTPAPELSVEEAARVAAFDAAPVPPEVRVETVARALEDACGDDATWLTLAAAAIAALPPSPAEEAVKRVEALAEGWMAGSMVPQYGPRWFAYAIRAALASPAPARHVPGDGCEASFGPGVHNLGASPAPAPQDGVR